jgi:NAD(P)-dependent dehydrogenase (short-subunit alcohol dehydrogenase family)
MQAEALKAQAASLGEGHDVITFVVDVSDEAQVQKMVDDTIAKFGRLDYAANCAGIPGDRGSNSEYDFEAFNKVLQINMGGVFLCMRAQLKAMAKQDLVDG